MFKDITKPSMNELIYWFMVTFPSIVTEMENSKHYKKVNKPNIYHTGDSSIWTHTMLVCKIAELEDYNKILYISCLLHDIGKPISREEIPETDRVRFIGHEGISFYLSIEILNKLKEINILNEKEINQILINISLHGTLFNYINKDGTMRKPEKIYRMFKTENEFETFIKMVKCDSVGRFNIDEKNNIKNLGKTIFKTSDFENYKRNIKNKELKLKLTLMIGIPGVGKSTWINKNFNNQIIISRDNILIDYGINKFGFLNYNQIWKLLSEEDQKEIDLLLEKSFENALKEKKNIIIDMTNISKKTQRKWINKTNNKYTCEAIIIKTSFKEVKERINKRKGKQISEIVLIEMMKRFSVPTYENFDIIEFI